MTSPLESRSIDGKNTLVFAGTAIPFESLLDCLRRNGSIEEFLSHNPSLTHEAALAALAHVAKLGADRTP